MWAFCSQYQHSFGALSSLHVLSKDRKFKSQLGYITFMVIYYKIISVVILPILLIQKGQSSVFWQKYVHKYWLTVWIKPTQENCELTGSTGP